MLKENRKTLIITSILTVLPIVAGLLLWKRLPDPVATHFGLNNEADGYTSKALAVFGLPLFCLAVLWFGAVFTARDPKRKNISPRMFTLILWLVPVISIAGNAATYSYNLGHRTDITTYGMLLMGIILTVTGNFLPKARQNYTLGIKLPWTLANEENWNRTHRLAGYLWTAGGILVIVLALMGLGASHVMPAAFAAMVFIPFIYSYLLHTKGGL